MAARPRLAASGGERGAGQRRAAAPLSTLTARRQQFSDPLRRLAIHRAPNVIANQDRFFQHFSMRAQGRTQAERASRSRTSPLSPESILETTAGRESSVRKALSQSDRHGHLAPSTPPSPLCLPSRGKVRIRAEATGERASLRPRSLPSPSTSLARDDASTTAATGDRHFKSAYMEASTHREGAVRSGIALHVCTISLYARGNRRAALHAHCLRRRQSSRRTVEEVILIAAVTQPSCGRLRLVAPFCGPTTHAGSM